MRCAQAAAMRLENWLPWLELAVLACIVILWPAGRPRGKGAGRIESGGEKNYERSSKPGGESVRIGAGELPDFHGAVGRSNGEPLE
jgi:hypothetical protein